MVLVYSAKKWYLDILNKQRNLEEIKNKNT